MDCVKNDGNWYSDKCYKPRYAFIKNEPGIDFTKLGDNSLTKIANKFGGSLEGNATSIIGDILSFSPNNLMDIVNLKNTKDFILEPCIEYMTGNYSEHFNKNNQIRNAFLNSLLEFIITCFFIMIAIVIMFTIITQ